MWDEENSRKDPAPSSPPGGGAERGRQPGGSSSDQTTVIGPSIKLKGELSGGADLQIEGRVDGKIELKKNHLSVGPSGRVKADVMARRVSIRGEVRGNVQGSERVEILAGGKIFGDVITPKIIIEEGGLFSGGIQMEGAGAPPKPSTPTKKIVVTGEPVPEQPLKI